MYPGGTGSPATDAIVADYYRSGRYGWGTMTVYSSGLARFRLRRAKRDTDAGDFAAYKAMIDEVKAEKSWTVLYFHGIYPGNPVGR